MTKKEFKEWAKKGFIFLDGATGSNLMKAGMPAGVCPEQWILEHEDVMENLQKEYVKAGTNILYAPTFTANRIKLEEYGLDPAARRCCARPHGDTVPKAARRYAAQLRRCHR